MWPSLWFQTRRTRTIHTGFFSDNGLDIPVNSIAPDTLANFPNHRKVVQYFAFVDSGVGDPGDVDHGTHVAGSVAGHHVAANPNDPEDVRTATEGNGVAYGAKIAMPVFYFHRKALPHTHAFRFDDE